ncbi:unnamed protein product [Lota lota]
MDLAHPHGKPSGLKQNHFPRYQIHQHIASLTSNLKVQRGGNTWSDPPVIRSGSPTEGSAHLQPECCQSDLKTRGDDIIIKWKESKLCPSLSRRPLNVGLQFKCNPRERRRKNINRNEPGWM